jgi:hypothetical protein
LKKYRASLEFDSHIQTFIDLIMKKTRKTTNDFEEILAESLRFHGMLTPSKEDESKPEITLPVSLQEPDFLFNKKQQEEESFPQIRLAAFKASKKKKK